MDAKEILKKIRAVFDNTQIIPPAPAPTVPAIPAQLASNYPIDGGGPVYISGDSIDIATPVFSDEALTMPYPDGSYTVTGTDFTFTVAGGIVTVVAGTLVAAAPPATLPPIPSGPTIPQFEAMQAEVKALQTQNATLKAMLDKHEKILPDLFELAEKLTELPASIPQTLNDRQQEKFDYAKDRDNRINQIAKTLKTIKTK